jgi:predicted DNA-binding transcriptional regulator AlpA
MVEQRQIPFKRFGKKIIRFDKREIDKWVDMHYDKRYHVA